MPVIAPLPMDSLDEDSRVRIEAGLKSGMYTQSLPLQIIARAPAALRAMDEGYKSMFRRSLLDDRLRELLRIRSAQLNGCGPCSQSRKEESVTEEDVVCLTDPDAASYSRREQLALRFLTLLCMDHGKITPATYQELAEEFAVPEIVELGYTCASSIGAHRFMHTLDILGTAEPVLG
jgi:alkylhydroperoxidase family enzyme